MYLLIDNYDSFTHNLYHLFGECGRVPVVERNDVRPAKEIVKEKPKAVIISPGPGHPKSAGICIDLVKYCFDEDIPVLGVCLGHQIIGHAFGATVIRNHEIVHGKLSLITNMGNGVLKNCSKSFKVTRYHSLVLQENSIPECLDVTAKTESGVIMGVQHKTHKIYGVQFHPESIASQEGKKIVNEFIRITEGQNI